MSYRGWITPAEGRVLEDVFVSDAKEAIYFMGRPRMVEESEKALTASALQHRRDLQLQLGRI